MPDMLPGQTPQVRDRSEKPTGVLPKNVQAWIGCGLALVIITMIALAPTTPTRKAPPNRSPAPTSDAAQTRIRELDDAIKQQQWRIEQEQAELLQANDRLHATVS